LLFILGTARLAYPQADGSNYPYLLRLAHETSDRYSCVLLRTAGAFHAEANSGETTKVYEGRLDAEKLQTIERTLHDPTLASLTQSQIEEPLIRNQEDRLQVSIVRNGGWQDLNFQSLDSQRPFEHSLRPLVRWMDDLHKLPHKKLSEDAGKNNCQPARSLALKKRSFTAATSGETTVQSGPADSISALLRVYSFSMKGGGAHQQCVLITENGKYRFEDRAQKAEGKPVETQVSDGEISSGDLQELHRVLDTPGLANLRHHEPPGGRIPVMGDILDLTISRATGDQKLFLSGGFGREIGAFFGGDGPLTIAGPLMKFLAEHVERNSTATVLDRSLRNGCSQP
jgi:hypothetical protein